MSDNNTIVAHGYGGYGHVLKYIPNPGGIYMDSGLVHVPWGSGAGFKPIDFEAPLTFCPESPESIKTGRNFSPKDYKSLAAQGSIAFSLDLNKPEDYNYFFKAVALAGRPAYLFSGKMRLFMQCVYAAREKSKLVNQLGIELWYQEDGSATVANVQLGDFQLSHDVILHTDTAHYRYFLIQLSGNSATVAEIVFDKRGEKLLTRLRSGEVDFSKISLDKVEGFLFSCAKSVKNTKQFGGFDVSPYGAPLDHNWNSNWDGSQAVMVPVIRTATNLTSCLATLSISKTSLLDNSSNWIDTWSFSLAISGTKTGNPRRSSDNIFVRGEVVFTGNVRVPVSNLLLYAHFNRNELMTHSYTGTANVLETIDSGWNPPPRWGSPLDSWGIYCGEVNCSRTREYRSSFNKQGFNGLMVESGVVSYMVQTGSSTPYTIQNGTSPPVDGCTGLVFDVKTAPFSGLAMTKAHLMDYTFTTTYKQGARSGSSFFFISPYDPEAVFFGKRQIEQKTGISTSGSTSRYIERHDFYDYNYTDPYSSMVGTGYVRNSNSPGSGSGFSYTSPNEYTERRTAICALRNGEQLGVSTDAYDSLYSTSFTMPGSGTSFIAFANQSALEGRAIYSSGTTLSTYGFTPCDDTFSMTDRWIGNI